MAGNTKKLRIEILGKTKQFTDNLTKTQRRMDAFGKTATKMGKTLAKGLGLATVAAVGVSKEVVKLASDAAEAGAAFEVVFGESVAELNEFVDEFANKAGLATFELQDLLKTTGQVVQGIGMTSEESAELSEKLAVLAGDVAAFNNVQGGAKPVIESFTKALLGERESLATYGVKILEAEVQTKAFLMTGKKNAQQLTVQEKALATYELIVEKTAVTQGYLNAEQESFAAKSNKAGAQVREMKALLGEELLPIVTDMIPMFMDFIKSLNPSLTNAIKSLAPFLKVVGELIAMMLPPILAVVTAILDKLAPVFEFMSRVINKTLKPAIQNLPGIFSDAINKVINKINSFLNVLNKMASKIQGFFNAIGMDIKIPKLQIPNVNFGSGSALPPSMAGLPSYATTTPTPLPPSVTSSATPSRVTTPTAVADPQFQSGGNTVINVSTSPFQDDAKVADEIVRILKTKERNAGSVPIKVSRSQSAVRIL